MTFLATARFAFVDSLAASASLSLRRPRSPLRSSCSSISTTTRWAPRRRFSIIADSGSDLFHYTSGRWIINDALRHEERRKVFNVDGLSRLAAESLKRSPDDIVSFEKLAEGGFNRIFLITMRDGFRLVARIPYPVTVPKYCAVASEVATMDLLRSSGLPIPKVYGYSPTSDNAAETEYIFMEFVDGTKLSNIWFDLEERDIVSVMQQLVELEAKMMSMSFPAGGSLYYARDLEKLAGKQGIPLEDERFCVGPDARLPLWYGRRSLLDVDRGPYARVESALISTANKELAYLRQFGQPLLPFQRMRREKYKYQAQPPADHITNLQRYLCIAPSLVPANPSLNCFRIRHPDLQEGNIIVSKSPDAGLRVVSVLDWQHASILPAFLHAGIPQRLQNYADPVSHDMTCPVLPQDLDALAEGVREYEVELHRRRLVHYHYVKCTEEGNAVHQAALADPVGVLRRRLFTHAGDPWEGETINLKVDLIEATQRWEELAGAGVPCPSPCPIAFDAEDIRATMELDAELGSSDETMQDLQRGIGFAEDGWVPRERYAEAMALAGKMRVQCLAVAAEEKRAEIEEHWPLDDMDEEKYM